MQTQNPYPNAVANFGPEPQFWRLLKFLPLILIGLGIWWVTNYFFGDQWDLYSIRGNYSTASYITEGRNAGKTFLVTDDTFYFISEVSSPGRRSVSRNSLLNRVYYYLYDQDKKKVEKRVKLNFDTMPPDMESYFVNGKIWLVGAGGSSKANDIWVINADTFEVEKTLTDLEKEIPEFKPGVMSVSKPYYREQILNFPIQLLDGSNLEFFPEYMKAFKSYNEFLDWLVINKGKVMAENYKAVYIGNSSPQKLTWTEGPKALVLNTLDNNNRAPSLEYNAAKVLEKVTGKDYYSSFEFDNKTYNDDPTFVEGRILYQDGEYALIIHQKNAQELAPRILTLIKIDQGIVWNLMEDQLPEALRVDPNNTFSQIFFIDSKLTAARAEKIIFFKFYQLGMVAIDIESGKIVWSIGKWNI